MNKATLTNISAFLLVCIGFFLPDPWSEPVKIAGLFALSGALTNHLAIHMLFHKVPLMYGSGVIEANFDRFKKTLREVIVTEFFSQEHIERFLSEKQQELKLAPLIASADFDPAFDALKQSVMESKFAGALNLLGGEEALEGLREPFKAKLSKALRKIVESDTFKTQLQQRLLNPDTNKELQKAAVTLIDKRLDALTPRTVKEIVRKLIARHLGWLVVWGGVIGGAMGLLSSLFISST